MAVDVTSLEIRVKSLEAKNAAKNLDAVDGAAGRAERATDGLTAAFVRLAGPVAIVAASVKGLKETVRVTREFDILNAGLITATESAESAAVAFAAIQQFAVDTPYDLQQVTDGFLSLVNRGLDPSERALTSYGDTAASLGRSLGDFINAVSQATTNEFESLKTFGIKSKNLGDTVSFTFRGTTTVVKNSAAEIEEYLIRLGEVNFDGAMERRMNSLDGAISNLGDSWSKLVLDVSNSGLGATIEENVRELTKLLDLLGGYAREFSGNLNLADVEREIDTVTRAIGEARLELLMLQETGQKPTSFKFLPDIGILKDFKSAIRDFTGESTFEEVSNTVGELENRLTKLHEMREKLKPAGDGDALAGFKVPSAADPAAIKKLDIQMKTEEEKIEASYSRRNETIKAYREALNKAVTDTEKLLASETDEIRKKSLRETLSDYKKQQNDFVEIDKRMQARSDKIYEEKKKAAILKVEQQLASEAELISQAYDDRQAVIDSYYSEKDAKHKLASDRNLARFDEETALLAEAERRRQFELEEARILERDSKIALDERLMTEAEAYIYHNDLLVQAEREHQQVMDEIKTNAYLTETERMEAEQREHKRFQEAKLNAEIRTNQLRLDAGAQVAKGLGDITAGLAGKESKAAKIAFAVQKAFTVASSILSIQQSISKAAAIGWPQNIPVIAQAVTTGASIISTIKGTNYSGAYDDGGFIPAGKWGIVGEYGPEIAEGPLNITSRKKTAELAKSAMTTNNNSQQSTTTHINKMMEVQIIGSNTDRPDDIAAMIRDVILDEKRQGGLLAELA